MHDVQRSIGLSKKKEKRFRILGKVLFVFYIIFLIYFLCFSEWYGRVGTTTEYRYNLELFKEIKRFVAYREELGIFAVYTNLLGNILIFVPYGFLVAMASRYRGFWKTFVYSFGLSLGVEVFQLVTRVGSFDVDDILLNTLGGVLGYLIFLAFRRHSVKRHSRGVNRK